MKNAEFARLAGCDRAVITRMLKAGRLVRDSSGGLDPSNPVNADFLRTRTAKQAAAELADPDDLDDSEIDHGPPADDARFVAALEAAAKSGGVDLGLTPDELRTMARRGYFEARRIQVDGEMRQLKLDERRGALIPMELASGFCETITQLMYEAIVQKPPQWGTALEARLGIHGAQQGVIEQFLSDEIARNIDYIKRMTLKVLSDLHDLEIPFDENGDPIIPKKETTI